MALSASHQRWLLTGPTILIVGLIVLASLAVLMDPRRATFYGLVFLGTAFLASLFSTTIAVVEHWPPFRGWPAKDRVCLVAGSCPLLLGLAVMAVAAYQGASG